MILLHFTKLLDGLDGPAELELGPFESVEFEGGWFLNEAGEQIAEVFEETINDVMSNVFGHPAAGKIFVPRTFEQLEADDPEYPGKGYGKVTIKAVTT